MELTRFADIKTWYSTLGGSDRLALKVLGGFLAIVAFIYLLWLPAQHYRAGAEAHYREQMELLASMQTNRGLFAAGNVGTATASTLSLVAESAKDNGLVLQNYEPVQGSNGVRVTMENAKFDTLIVWLAALADSERIEVVRMTLDKTANDGMVNVNLELRR